MKHRYTLAVLLAAIGLVLTACGSSEESNQTEPTFNQADVEFAQGMIPHHQQAVEMASLAKERASAPEVKQLATDIEGAQQPEIDTMTQWLESWGEEVPDSGMEHGGGHEMPGMMTEDQMTQLEQAKGGAFDRMFLEMMIEHHEGAIEMAKTEQAEGENSDAIKLAEGIEKAQTQEITLMKDLLAS